MTDAGPAVSLVNFAPDDAEAVIPSIDENLWLWAVLLPEADPTLVAAQAGALGAKKARVLDDRRLGGVARIEAVLDPTKPAEMIQAIAGIDGVNWIERVPETTSDAVGMPDDLLESGTPDYTPISAAGLHGQNQVISVTETGPIDLVHCWFKDNNQDAPGPGHRKVVAVHDNTPSRPSRHSAFVAGILAGQDLSGSGAVPNRGIAWEARITYCNRADFRGETTPATFLDYLNLAADDGAHIHNNSWHSTSGRQYSQNARDVDTFSWTREDCLVVASSGNTGEEMGAPCVAKNALWVSAAYVGPGGSCFGDGVSGPTDDNRRKPDILAPGCAIRSALAESGCSTELDERIAEHLPPHPACASEAVYCFTSFAAPVISAAAAIVRQYFVEGRYPFSGDALVPSGALIKAVLLNSTEKTTSSTEYPSDSEGWGLLQLDRGLYLGQQGDGARKLRVWDVPNQAGLITGGSQPFEVNVESPSLPLKVTLVWTDPPAQGSGADPLLVNNLDLVVVPPGGGEPYLGNHFSGGESVRGGTPDDRNNVEVVLVNAPAVGRWSISVTAARVDQNQNPPRQGFALVASGSIV